MEKQKADQIITEYMQKLYGFAIKRAYSYDEAEELCAEIIKEVYSSLLKAREVFHAEGYIRRISEYTYSKYVSCKKSTQAFLLTGWKFRSMATVRLQTPMRTSKGFVGRSLS